jgi:pyruvate/2-oxoglutarate/acetoin dehydrogenase E1 component
MEEAFDHLDAPVLRVAAPEVAAFGISPVLEDFSLPSVEKITQALRHLAAY